MSLQTSSILIVVFSLFLVVFGWGTNHEKVLLSDVRAITLHQHSLTTGRRSSPVPQLKCVGGSAGCTASVPSVVQCRNVGSDGVDAQWECKAQMDDAYKFGRIEVTCEGYDHPNDPYILKGSCGLEYTIELTGKGHHKNNNNNNYYQKQSYKKDKTGGSWFIFFVIIFAVGFVIYKMSNNGGAGASPGTTPRQPPRPRGQDGRPYPSAPPNYGFKQEYTQGTQPPSYQEATTSDTNTNAGSTGYNQNQAGYAGTQTRTQTNRNNTGNGFGGFWGGAAAGGLAGYLFGSRNNNRGYGGYGGGYGGGYNRGWGYGGNTGWGSGSTWHRASSSSSGSDSSSSTYSATGYGGTSRR